MSDFLLDSEEQELLDAYEAGKFESDLSDERRAYLVDAARETFRRDQQIAVLLSRRDLAALQRRALEDGLSYQSLAASVLHKYLSGSLKDLSPSKAQHKAS